MSTLSLTLSNSSIISFELNEKDIAYFKLTAPELRLHDTGVQLWEGGIRPRKVMDLIYMEVKPFGACCGLDCWENLVVDTRVSYENMFHPWIEWRRQHMERPALCVLVRLVTEIGPTDYTHKSYSYFANYGELIAQYRNTNYADHLLEVITILPTNSYSEFIRKVAIR